MCPFLQITLVRNMLVAHAGAGWAHKLDLATVP